MSESGTRAVKLYLGAHKTATTYLQEQLELHSQDFEQCHYYLKLKEMRGSITPLAIDRKQATQELSDALSQYRTYQTLILSDENLLGTPRQLKAGTLYSGAEEACIKLRKAFGSDVRYEVYFTIRDYRDFIPSMYCEYLRHNSFCTFDKYLESSGYHKLNWVNLYRMLVDVFGRDQVIFFNFETFSKYEALLMDKLLPSGQIYKQYRLDDRPSIARASFCESAIKLFELGSDLLDRQGQKKLVKLVEAGKLDDNWSTYQKYRPLKNDSLLKKRYKKHVKTLEELGNYM